MLYSRFSLIIYFIHSSVYMSIPISQFIPPPPPSPSWCPYIYSLHLCLYFCHLQATLQELHYPGFHSTCSENTFLHLLSSFRMVYPCLRLARLDQGSRQLSWVQETIPQANKLEREICKCSGWKSHNSSLQIFLELTYCK